MAAKKNFDENVRILIEQGIEEVILDDEMRKNALKSITEKLMPVYSEAAIKRKMTSYLRAAYKEGFILAKRFGKYSQWREQYWLQSQTSKETKIPANDQKPELVSRYASLNYE